VKLHFIKTVFWPDSLDLKIDLKYNIYFVLCCNGRLMTLREEHKLRVFENRVLRRIFGPKRDEVTRDWRKLHNE
jgi:hypothetical protein